jgi:hypothetical protein
MKFKIIIGFLIAFSLLSCSVIRVECNQEAMPTSKNQNVCKELKDSVIIYAVFVDAGIYHPWSLYDVNSTIDSIQKAADWMESQASSSGKHIGINVVNHKHGSKLSFTEARARSGGLDINRALGGRKRQVRAHNYWMDRISRYTGRGMKKPPAGKLGTRNRIRNTERLMAALRDKYKTDNVALMIFVNGYYEHDPSFALYTESNGPRTEYCLMTTKNPAVIAHEFLHLFGAVDLYPTMRFANFNFADIDKNYPNEIMRIQHKEISKLEISPITQYLIGWKDDMDHRNTRMLYHKSNFLEY